jgi:anthranilate phosphoribosyltransferase
MKEYIETRIEGNFLGIDGAKKAMLQIGRGEVSADDMLAFISSFFDLEISAHELLGFRSALIELCIPVTYYHDHKIDLCGTGGDGKNTFNVSTISSIVCAASGGLKVVKHGNYGVSSAVGSSNVIESLGYQFTNDNGQLSRELDEAGITFLHAPLFHPALKHVAPIRKALGRKTIFNMLGPLVNPSQPDYQVTGVYSRDLIGIYDFVLREATWGHAVVHSKDIYDEISLTSDFIVQTKDGNKTYSPAELNLSVTKQAEIDGGETVEQAAAILHAIINGKGSKAQNEVVAANAGLAISVGKNISFIDGIAEAKEIIESGKAALVLKKLLEINKA